MAVSQLKRLYVLSFFFFLFVSYGTLMPTVHDCGCGRGIPHWLFGGSLAGVEVARNADFQKGG